jgi:hypothetical protein
MKTREQMLLDDIETAALDSAIPLADALRKAISLGGAVQSGALREWASRELTGYEGVPDEEIPSYRTLPALIQMDSIFGTTIATGQTVAPSSLPDFVAEKVKESVTLRFPVAEIEVLAQSKEPVRLTLPMGADLARLLHLEWQLDRFQQVTALYWTVAPSSVRGVVDRVRTSLTELVAEIRAGLGDDDDGPSAELTNQALNIAVHGDDARITVTQASGQNVITVGDENVVDAKFQEVIEELDALKRDLLASDLPSDEKQDVSADIDALKLQLTKNDPDLEVGERLWGTIEKAANAAGLTQAAIALGAALGQLL